jgi:uncharacterized membrane protein YphA (DoxX/SURF4 family)
MSGWIYNSVRWVLGSVFIYAGTMKLLDPEIFAVLMEAYGIIPENLLMPIAIALPAAEVVAGIGLLVDIKGSLAAIAGLLVLFTAILAYGIWMGLDVDCGCFGPGDPEATAFHSLRPALYRNLAMALGVFLTYMYRRLGGIKPVDILSMPNGFDQERRRKNAHA